MFTKHWFFLNVLFLFCLLVFAWYIRPFHALTACLIYTLKRQTLLVLCYLLCCFHYCFQSRSTVTAGLLWSRAFRLFWFSVFSPALRVPTFFIRTRFFFLCLVMFCFNFFFNNNNRISVNINIVCCSARHPLAGAQFLLKFDNKYAIFTCCAVTLFVYLFFCAALSSTKYKH